MKNFILTGWPFVHLWRSEGPGGQGGRDKKEKELGEKIVRITSTYWLNKKIGPWTWCGPFISGLPSYLRKNCFSIFHVHPDEWPVLWTFSTSRWVLRQTQRPLSQSFEHLAAALADKDKDKDNDNNKDAPANTAASFIVLWTSTLPLWLTMFI